MNAMAVAWMWQATDSSENIQYSTTQIDVAKKASRDGHRVEPLVRLSDLQEALERLREANTIIEFLKGDKL